jgi:hypothetical protein
MGLVDDCREATTLPSGPRRLRVTLGGLPLKFSLAVRVPWPERTEKVWDGRVTLREPENDLVTVAPDAPPAMDSDPTSRAASNDHRTAPRLRRRLWPPIVASEAR